MTPFMEFRLWLREGPSVERRLASVSALLACALVAWGVLPTGSGAAQVGAGGFANGPASSATGTGTAAETVIEGSGPVGSVPAPAATGEGSGAGSTPADGGSGGGQAAGPTDLTSGVGGGSVPAAAGSGCDKRATDVGVTENEVLIGVVIYSLGEGNSLLGIPPAQESKDVWNAVIDQVNRSGGIQCRTVKAVFYEEFVLSAESGRTACLNMQQDGVFALMNNLFNTPNRPCPMAAGIPNFWATSPDKPLIDQFPGLILSFQPDYERLFRDYVYGAKAMGFFDDLGPTAKLGILDQSCNPERGQYLRGHLEAIGIPSSRWSAYNYGCTGAVPSPTDHNAAALQFNRDRVSHVVSAHREAPSGFAAAAANQGLRPKFAMVNDASSPLANNANPPYHESFDGTLYISKTSEGAEYTPGATHTQATAECTAITDAAGYPGPTDTGTLEGSLHALACIHMKMFVAAAQRTVPLTRAGLGAGMAAVGDLDLSFPAGPSRFDDPSNLTGGQFWRPTVYRDQCTCVQLLEETWRPQF